MFSKLVYTHTRLSRSSICVSLGLEKIESHKDTDSRCPSSPPTALERVLDSGGFASTPQSSPCLRQSCPWVGLTHGFGLGWVDSGSRIFVSSGLGRVMGLKWQTLGLDCRVIG